MRGRIFLLLGVVALLGMLIIVPGLQAQDQVTVPTIPGQSVTVTWTGTTLPGANPTSECSATSLGADSHAVGIAVPTGAYTTVSVLATATVTFSGTTDMIVTILRPDGSSVSADAGSFGGAESASISNPSAGSYTVIACPFAGVAPQAYTGTLKLTA